MMFYRNMCTIVAGLALAVPTTGSGSDGFSVTTYGMHDGAKLIYVYRVTNNDPLRRVGTITIGTDYFGPGSELSAKPVGYTGAALTEALKRDEWLRLTPESYEAPLGWTATYEVEGEGEAGAHSIGFQNQVPYDGIEPGDSAEFRLVVSGADIAHLRGHFVVFATPIDNTRGYLMTPIETTKYGTGLMIPVDVANPRLSVRLSPSSVSKLSGTSLKVQAILTATDDYDPQPEVKLESISASVPLNQSEIKDAKFGTDDRLFILPVKKDPTGNPVVYTVTYSAMDGTGNKATSNATVTLNP